MSRLIVVHSYYGCDSGCCGHTVEVEPGDPRRFRFEFEHAENTSEEEAKRDFIERMVGAENLRRGL